MDEGMPESHGKTRRLLGRWVAAASVVLVVGTLAGLLWLRTSGIGAALVSPNLPAFAPGVPLASTAGWQLYRDPQDLFSIKAPADWTLQQEQGSGQFGDNSGSYSFTGESVWLGVPPENVDGLDVWVNVVPLTTDYSRQWECRAFSQGSGPFSVPSTTLGGIPASYDGGDTWMVEAHDAHFQINAHYPGGPESPHTSPDMRTPPPTPTPVPPDQLASGRQVIATVLSSFTLTNPTPLSC